MPRALESGLLGGSIAGGVSTLVLRVLQEAASSAPPAPFGECICPVDLPLDSLDRLDWRSVIVGFSFGFLAWPFLDFLVLVKAYVSASVCSRLRRLLGVEPYHRLL